jgi:hypothetical protein
MRENRPVSANFPAWAIAHAMALTRSSFALPGVIHAILKIVYFCGKLVIVRQGNQPACGSNLYGGKGGTETKTKERC